METTEWGRSEYVVNQLIEYKIFDPENMILTVIMQLNSYYIKAKLKSQNIEIIDNLLSTENMKKFKQYVLNALS